MATQSLDETMNTINNTNDNVSKGLLGCPNVVTTLQNLCIVWP